MINNKINIFGANINAISLSDAVSLVEEQISQKHPGYVCVCPVSSIVRANKDEDFRQTINNSFLSTPDGMPVVWYIKSKGFKKATRVYGPDLMSEMFKVSQIKGYRHYFYGGTEDVLEKLKKNLLHSFSALSICGMHAPPFREKAGEEEQEIIDEINGCSPDIIWVGIGSPKQERWMQANVNYFDNAVLIGVGAGFNFYAGTIKQAPKWMQRTGLEWLFRLFCEPRRLWKRYLFGNTKFIYLVLKEILMDFFKKSEKRKI